MKLIIFSAAVIGLVLFFVFTTQVEQDAQLLDSYNFPNTSSWDPELLLLADREVLSVEHWKEYINIPSPPANSSQETKSELLELMMYKDLRTPEKIRQIEKEMDNKTIFFGGRPLLDYFDYEKYPETALLFAQTYNDMTTIVLVLKKQYNRVRPHILELEIMPIIDVPKHAAYPSGHSTQLHFMAYLLGEVLPEQEEELILEADNIAKNREIAGVHYKSDSEAGKILARQFVDLLLANPEIQRSINKSREELLAE